MSTTINIYLTKPASIAVDASSGSSARNSSGAPMADTQPIIINAGDFAQVNVIPSYAGNSQRGGVVGSGAADGAKWPADQQLADFNGMARSSAAMTAQAGNWVNAFRSLVNRAAGPDAAMVAQAGFRANAFKGSPAHVFEASAANTLNGSVADAYKESLANVFKESAASAFKGAAPHAFKQSVADARKGSAANASNESINDALGQSTAVIPHAGKLADDLNALRNDVPKAIPVPLFAEPQRWNPYQNYAPGDRVSYGGNVYQVPSSGGRHMSVEPGTDDSRWLYAGTVENNHRYALHQYVEEHLHA